MIVYHLINISSLISCRVNLLSHGISPPFQQPTCLVSCLVISSFKPCLTTHLVHHLLSFDIMSTRSTPRAGSSQLPRTLSFSSEVSFDPSSSRRHTRTDSLRMPTLPESVVSSGLSSPDTRRRRYLSRKKSDSKGSVAGMREEVDWAGVEPDEVFRRLPISEIKRVEQKMRTDALNKQSELRSMVG